MSSALKKILGIRTTSLSSKFAKASLFSGSAYFSNRVPKAFTEKWVAHGGEISSGTTLDVRARYFFATDPSDPWVTKLFVKSVMVIHAGWIVQCVDEAFQVPIAEYVLDGRLFYVVTGVLSSNFEMLLHSADRFVPGPPYKLTNIVPSMYVPLSDPGGYTESGESGPTPVQTSDTPSTPTSMRRKRKREQAYFDSPSGSFVFSGFDKDGMPRRPRKLRKLRFNPSFSPKGGRSGRETKQGSALDWLRDPHEASRGDDVFSGEHSQHTVADTLRGPSHMTPVRSPDPPDRLPACGSPSATYRRHSIDEHLSKPTRTIDFTNLPPPTRRWRFPQANATNSGDTGMILSVVKPTDHKVKTPKKISFANRAQVCVYMVSPRQPDVQDGAGPGPARQCLREGSGDGLKVNDKTPMLSDGIEGSDDSTAETIKGSAPQTDSPKINGDPSRLLGGDQFENNTLTFTMEEVQAMRRRLLESAAKNDTDNGQLATLFEPGKTFRGKTFRHVW
ncbi:hypothetical protein J3R82DRAFT_2655 [Butyriboletus roseoflavus]|nr:hypothetical protein J3R82DRAFT_2655 [Butyriboletus roseoflavus]